MTRRDQKLLEKQLWSVSSRSPQNGMTILIIVAVFLVGMGIGDIVSKTKQAEYTLRSSDFLSKRARLTGAAP